VQVDVPYGTRPGRYAASLAVTVDGKRTVVPVRIRVFPVTLPRPGSRVGNLLTSFNLSPESYVSKSAQLFGFSNHDQRVAANRGLFGLLGAYRVSPASWGFGEPRTAAGYESDSRWWLDSAGNFLSQLRASPGFSSLRIPISSNRTAAHNYIAQMSPFVPETWCEYLGRVRSFWSENEVLGAGSLPYLFGYDEPSLEGERLVARQAKALHDCFPGGAQMMTGNPTRANAFLWDGKGGDDLDVWTVLSRRYYGTWTSPAHTHAGTSRARSNLALIERVRARGKMVWAYTYTGTPGTPGFAATEPLSNARMLMLWTALENVQGLFYAQGLTSYATTDPRASIGSGEKILVYRGRTARGRARASCRSGTASRTGRSSTSCASAADRRRCGRSSGTRDSSARAARACGSRAISGASSARPRSTRGRAGRATPRLLGGSSRRASQRSAASSRAQDRGCERSYTPRRRFPSTWL
jgi:hypothetical protein